MHGEGCFRLPVQSEHPCLRGEEAMLSACGRGQPASVGRAKHPPPLCRDQALVGRGAGGELHRDLVGEHGVVDRDCVRQGALPRRVGLLGGLGVAANPSGVGAERVVVAELERLHQPRGGGVLTEVQQRPRSYERGRHRFIARGCCGRRSPAVLGGRECERGRIRHRLGRGLEVGQRGCQSASALALLFQATKCGFWNLPATGLGSGC